MDYKLKSHKGAAKRFKKSINGFKRKKSNARHILTKKSTKLKRELRKKVQIKSCDTPQVKQMLPYC